MGTAEERPGVMRPLFKGRHYSLSVFPAVDILLSHNSPRGVHDREDQIHCGFDELRTYIDKARPKVLVHGHQHVDRETSVGETGVIGVYGHKVIEV